METCPSLFLANGVQFKGIFVLKQCMYQYNLSSNLEPRKKKELTQYLQDREEKLPGERKKNDDND